MCRYARYLEVSHWATRVASGFGRAPRPPPASAEPAPGIGMSDEEDAPGLDAVRFREVLSHWASGVTRSGCS